MRSSKVAAACFCMLTGALAATILISNVGAEDAEVESGLPVGGGISSYSTTKCGGIDDGVAVGKSLCYT